MAADETSRGEPISENVTEERISAAEFRGFVKEFISAQKNLNNAFAKFLSEDLIAMRTDVAYTKGRTAALVWAVGVLCSVLGGSLITLVVSR